ncbi:Hypothetical predicted protein [Mytilus galloprovincialis]|uniref:DZIP3-like HEPN domain-containing protein n=1 Tax=Mytilus galloprovincialis TaxID=29158 RepID=A0A8B6C7U5_MYTGA|nr:Hypothetical predicted protein [Mytilus galloprovincialis]
MGDPESDEHLRIFKCLVDTGSDVLRYTVERKMLINTSFEQYLNQNKHKFYHQFEKRRYKPCCSGNPHNCAVNGKMDKKIFFKMYNKKAELDTQDCLDRFEVNADISLDKLDLSDINFFLWNSATLSPQEEQSLKAIMTTRSAICHSSSSREFSLDELENCWLSLKNDLLLFAEPNHYKKSIEREITTLRNCSLSKIESKRVLDKMKKLFHEIKLETEAKNKSIENQTKKGNEGLKDCFRLENNSIKTHMNEKMHEILETEMRIGKIVAQSQTQLSIKMEEEAHETRRQIKTRFKILLGVIGKQNITLGMNLEQIEELIESSDARDIYITSKLDKQCLTADKEKNVIENLQSEIQIPPDNDINPDISDKQAFQVIVKQVNSIILKLKATPGIFKSVETLKSALLTLVKTVQIAGKIDAEIEDNITIDLSFDSPLTKDQIAVVKCLSLKEWNDDNTDEKISKEHSSSAMANIESYPEHETSSHQAVTRPLCQACAEKDKQIKAYEEKTREHEKSIELNKLQEYNNALNLWLNGITAFLVPGYDLFKTITAGVIAFDVNEERSCFCVLT